MRALESSARAAGWKARKYRHVQISKLFSMEIRDQAVMDFLEATEVGNFPCSRAEFSICHSCVWSFTLFSLLKGKKDLPHLVGHPEGERKRALPYSR